MSDIRLRVENVSKSFRLPHEQHSSLKQTVLNLHKKLRSRKTENLKVLKDINLEVKDGEFFGIVGRNGSGKSTLLKLIAGIYQPTQGHIQVDGKLTPFIELGVGFNMELTGHDNIFLNGAILGLTRKQIEGKYDDIVAFAELGKFMDQKLKNYSSGMQVRLAFSIAIQAHSDLLLVDEVLAVGDASFQKKCFEVFKQMKQKGKTVVFVSHDMAAVKEYCNRAILIEDGKIVKQGDAENVISEYRQINLALARKELSKQDSRNIKGQAHFGTGAATIQNIQTEKQHGEAETIFKPKQDITLIVDILAHKNVTSPVIIVECSNPGGPPIFAVNSKDRKIIQDFKANQHWRLRWRVPNLFNDGRYEVTATVYDQQLEVIHDRVINSYSFEVAGWAYPHTLTHPPDSVSLEPITKPAKQSKI